MPRPLPYASYRVEADIAPDSPLWQELPRVATPLALQEGSMLALEGGHAFDVLCVVQGRLRNEFVASNGSQRFMLVYGRGTLVNLASAILKKPGVGQYLALEPCLLWRSDRALLTDPAWAARCPAFAEVALRHLARVTLTYQATLTDLTVDAFLSRFCRYLLFNIARHGALRFKTGLTQAECAATLGVHRATLARAVRTLRDMGILERFTRGETVVLDPLGLRRLAES